MSSSTGLSMLVERNELYVNNLPIKSLNNMRWRAKATAFGRHSSHRQKTKMFRTIYNGFRPQNWSVVWLSADVMDVLMSWVAEQSADFDFPLHGQ